MRWIRIIGGGGISTRPIGSELVRGRSRFLFLQFRVQKPILFFFFFRDGTGDWPFNKQFRLRSWRKPPQPVTPIPSNQSGSRPTNLVVDQEGEAD